jgi:GntR family transcriptional regulator, transcriptional repressor for pyruvate dehydrogenase complex
MGTPDPNLYDDRMIRSPELPLANQRLSDQLADDLRRQIESGAVLPGQRLPTELALAAQYAVSRTVVREAVSRLRSSGLLVARQGSGMFVAARDAARPLDFDSAVLADLGAVLDVVEVRRALESEVAALAATRATAAQRRAIQDALARADASIASGSAEVDEDLAFHQAVADAAGNPQFPRLLRHLEQYLRDAMAVTRRNESMQRDFIAQVRQEHQAIVDAILARDADAARAAATRHMHQAARRLHDSDAPIHHRPDPAQGPTA